MLRQQCLNSGKRRLWNRERKIRRLAVQAKDWPDIEVAVDGMQVQRRDGDMMCIGKPAALACALPSMLARLFRKFSRGSVPDPGARPVKSNTRRCGGGER